MCGIFGYVGKTPADITKIKILGIYNTTRGTDSCGISVNNKVAHGLKDLSNWTEFCEKTKIEVSADDDNFVVIGHTRNASVKSTKDDADCAHPIVVKTKKQQTKLIGVHNGTITNASKLAKEFNVKEGKIDSITLMNVLSDSNKNNRLFNVFKEYEGAATVMWYHPSEPNTLKIFKGASKESHGAKAEFVEERPLFCYKVDDNTFYFSSIKESLYCIGGELNTVSTVPFNCVITVKPGEKFRIRPIERTKVDTSLNSDTYYSPTTRYTTYGGSSDNFHRQVTSKALSRQLVLSKKLKDTFKGYNFSRLNQFPIVSNHGDKILIDNEPYTLDQLSFGSKITFWKGRYTRNGHIVGTKKDEYVEMELDIYGFEKIAKGKENPRCDLESLDKYYFFQGLLLLSKEHGDELLRKEKEKPFIFTKDGELNIVEIAKYFWGFSSNYEDKAGYSRDTSGNWCTGDYFPMFDYSKRYSFLSGMFSGAEIIDINLGNITSVIKSFETKQKIKPEVTPAIPLVMKASIPNYNSVFDDNTVDDEKLENLVQDARAALKAITDVIGENNTRYTVLSRKVDTFKRFLTKAYDDAKAGKIIESVTITPSNNQGVLYS